MALMIPGYRIERLLGRGSQAEVWAAVDTRSGERVALKRVPSMGGREASVLRAEASLLATLEHPSLIRFVEFLQQREFSVLVLELAEGGSLVDVLAQRQRLSAAEVGLSFSEIGAAVAHAHERGLVHGDISAANILYTAEGRPKLADLGVSRLVGTQSDVVGTLAYLDPVVAAGAPTDVSSDLFSLAAVALHALTGSGPWPASSSAEDLFAFASKGLIDDLATRLSDCPALMRQALMRALDPQPFRRGTAAEFALDLRASTEPVQVVLTAGRLDPAGGRHAASPASADGDPADGSPIDLPLHRPDFHRPVRGSMPPIPAHPVDLTRISRPQLRAALPVKEPVLRRAWRAARSPRAVLVVAVTALIALGLAVGTGLLAPSVAGALPWRSAGSKAPASQAPGHPRATAAPSPLVSASSVAPGQPPAAPSQPAAAPGASTGDPGAVTMSATTAVTILHAIDARRGRAYASANPALLDQVYSAPALLAADRSQLAASVPPGCILRGLTATYSRISVFYQQPGRVDLKAEVQLPAADLVCAGAVTARSAPTSPRMFAISLSRDQQGRYRIASQTALTD